jgi:hypothetical protein
MRLDERDGSTLAAVLDRRKFFFFQTCKAARVEEYEKTKGKTFF